MPSETIHNGFAETATRLIDRHGRAIGLLTIASGSDEWNPVQTESVADIVGVQTSYKAFEVDGEVIRSTDKKYLIDSSLTIDTNMRIRDDADYSIVDVTEVKPGTTSILYKVQARI